MKIKAVMDLLLFVALLSVVACSTTSRQERHWQELEQQVSALSSKTQNLSHFTMVPTRR